MSNNRPAERQIWAWAAILWMAAVGGCASSDSASSASFGAGGASGAAGLGGAPPEGAAGAGGDRGDSPALDDGLAAFFDNPVDLLFADPERVGPDLPMTGAAPEDVADYAQSALACYANACRAELCDALASCCVGTGACCLPVNEGAFPIALDFQSCESDTATACALAENADADEFGSLGPLITPRGLVPNGTAGAEGGVLIGEPIDLTSRRAEIGVRFALPVGCNETCLQSAGVAFTATVPDAFVDADVGLLLSGARRTVSLIIGNSVVASYEASPNSTEWTLVVSAEGVVEVLRNQESQGRHALDVGSLTGARLVAFGRNLGDSDDSAAIASLSVSTSVCDSPRAWRDRRPFDILDGPATPDVTKARSPSIMDAGNGRRVAFEVAGAIFIADETGPSELSAESSPALVPNGPLEAGGLDDPELVTDGLSTFLFYTARDANGLGRIGAAFESVGSFVKSEPPTLFGGGDVVSLAAPTVLHRGGLWVMVVRATLGDGSSELQAYYTSTPLGTWERVINGELEAISRVSDPTSELGAPSLSIHNSAYRLYFARRNGTRWSIELAVSEELLLWRTFGEVLGASGDGFDSLGARSPDAISRGDAIDLLYDGQDGVSFTIGSATRPAPAATASTVF